MACRWEGLAWVMLKGSDTKPVAAGQPLASAVSTAQLEGEAGSVQSEGGGEGVIECWG